MLAFFHSFDSKLTTREYLRAGRQFLNLAFADITNIGELSRDHLIFYQKWLKDSGQAPKTILKKMAAVASLCKHLAHEGFIDRDLSYGLKRPRSDNKRQTADFSDEEVRKLFAVLNPSRKCFTSHRALLAVGFYTGLRSAEIRHLKVKNLSELKGHRILSLIIKGGKPHEVPLNPFAYRCLSEHADVLHELGFDVKDPEQWLFPALNPIRNQPISANALDKILKNCIKKAGISCSSVRRYCPHSMRATLTGHLLNTVEAPLEQVQRTLGAWDTFTAKDAKYAKDLVLFYRFTSPKLAFSTENANLGRYSMFKADQTNQRQLFAFSVRDLIPENSDAWLYIDLFDELDLCDFEQDYSSQGEEGHDPRFILRTIFYGLTHGIVSGRKLADACCHDSRYLVLSGQNQPSYRTFSRFIIRHQQRIESLFVQVIRMAQKMGLVSLGRIAIDGSRFKAKTSKHKAMSYGRMVEAINTIKSELEKLKEDLIKSNAKEENAAILPAEISRWEKRLAKIQAAKAALEKEAIEAGQKQVDPKSQKSFHDLEAKPSKRSNGNFMYAYNCQAAVDADNQIIIAAEVHDSPSDANALGKMLDSVETNCKASASQVLADAAYNSYSNLIIASERGAEAFFATGKGEKSTPNTAIASLKYFNKNDQFRCMKGKNLKSINKQSRGNRGLAMPIDRCRGCHLKRKCDIYSRGAKTFWVPDAELFIEARRHHRRMSSSRGKAIYSRRKVIVEPVFGNIKNKNMRILRIGSSKTSCWWKMACTAHNIEKIIKHR